MITFFQTILSPIFGTFEREEFKKFLRIGAVFSFIIGSYWTLRPLKNAIFCTLVGYQSIPYAKTLSLLFLIPLLLFYSTLLNKFSRAKTFYLLSALYAALALIFGALLAQSFVSPQACMIEPGTKSLAAKIIGYMFYIFIESYGSLLPALFWAIASDTTKPESAKKGFSLVYALGQIGAIVGPYYVTSLPGRLGLTTSSLSVLICAATILISMVLLKNFFKKTPANLLESYQAKHDTQKKEEPGFFEGLKLLFSHKYLLGIFAVVAFPEFIMTVVDIHFQALASQQYTGLALAEYMGTYASSVNSVALIFLLCGIGNITRLLGVGVALFLMPIIYGAALLGFVSLDSLSFLFALMVSSKAINYALNGPAIKQLYIPTTHDVRFKSQAWIETFGSRGSKEAGSIFNFLLEPLQNRLGEIAGRARHAMLAGYVGFAVVITWLFIALFLGKKHKKALQENEVVC